MTSAAELRATCAGCGTELAASLLRCPACGRLVHLEQLNMLSANAEQAERDGNRLGAMGSWRNVLALLPADAAQQAAVNERIARLGEQRLPSESHHEAAKKTWLGRKGAIGAAVMALLLKFKFVILIVLAKGKLLLLGLTKLTTLGSMLLYLPLAWGRMGGGWLLGVGVVISIYIHEMGHVAALERYGIKASAPMFIPGFGAFIRLKEHPPTVRQDARVGLAGPIWGFGAAVVSYAIYALTHQRVWLGIASYGAFINLFNLLPFWQLDGGRGFTTLTREERWMACVALIALWFASRNGLLILLAMLAAYQAIRGGSTQRDTPALATYIGLAAALTLLARPLAATH